ncbi:MAG: carbamoyltransferase HypF [Pseudomonadota bacterium]
MASPAIDLARPARRLRLRVRGRVQGVGFRPFVYRLAREEDLSGFVLNDAAGVEIEVQGDGDAVERFVARLSAEAPPLARVDAVERETRALQAQSGFLIEASRGGRAATAVTPDAAPCGQCLEELFDPGDRRHRYAFTNCTHCGPRYTITARLPYDRPNTSMTRFALCPACEREYRDPADRRFHAEPNACPVCGPRLKLLDRSGRAALAADPIAEALTRLARGEIVAVKGLGGFHLMCDAANAEAVARLRSRKDREEKPFAVMVANAASAAPFVEIGAGERVLLESRERPIVLLRKRRRCDERLPGAAPGLAWLGVMLPYTPLQYLLFHEQAGRPAGTQWLKRRLDLQLVCTSANPGGEPLVTGNAEAVARLAGIADTYLVNDRDILTRCDDSVVRVRAGRAAFVRRARGYTPEAIALAGDGPPVLACGAYLKNTVCVIRGAEAFVSQHVGDLDNAATCVALEETAAHLLSILQVRPAAVACDLHPDFHSTRLAARLAGECGASLIQVQHHHAHVAAVAAEHRADGALLGLALDGVGLGADGRIWGGELLRVDGAAFERIAHLAPLRLPGGDRAAREPWRMAASALHALGRADEIERRYPGPAGRAVRTILDGAVHAPRTTSAGRLFDAAAGLLLVKPVAAFEGQAAMLLEGLAEHHSPVAPLAGGFVLESDGTLSLLPLLAALADEVDSAYGAALFHATLAEALAQWTLAAAHRTGLGRVALGGGCFLNHVLSAALRGRLEAAGLAVFEAEAVPPNDGGVALGQAAVARARLAGGV